MPKQNLTEEELAQLIRDGLNRFYERRIQGLRTLELTGVLKRKNPYLFRATGIETPSEMVAALLQAHMSSSDETKFGDAFFEPIATVALMGMGALGGGLDVQLETDEEVVVMAVKSGPNWANRDQKRQLREHFNTAHQVFRTRRSKKAFKKILGQCYGRTHGEPNARRDYYVLSGQALWQYMTDDPDFYIKLIRLMGDTPKVHREEYEAAFADAVRRFTEEFTENYCTPDGTIDWEKLTTLNSGARRQAASRKKNGTRSLPGMVVPAQSAAIESGAALETEVEETSVSDDEFDDAADDERNTPP